MDRRKRHQRVKELFFAAVEIEPTRREAFLAEECGDDQELRDEVRSFLALDAEDVEDLIDTPVSKQLVQLADSRTEASGGPDPGLAWSSSCETSPTGRLIRVGSYQIVKVLGKGRDGTSYLAQDQGSHQAIVKVSQTMCHEPLRWCRFEVERQVLKKIDHPAIARVYDAGDTEGGLVFIATEPVSGEPMDEYCDHKQLPIDDRLGLFIEVCRAVLHIHQKGLLHRDIRASNVLVDEIAGEARPKLVGFAIARPLQDAAAGQALLSLIDRPGDGESDFDIRSDVYSLGLLLCRLLIGKTSFKPGGSGSKASVQQPQLPSQCFAGLDPSVALPRAGARSTSPSALVRQLRGDLDWIVCKTTAAAPERYASAAELAADLERHRHGQPVTAAPDSSWYRLGKLVQRGRGAVVAVTLASLALFAGAAWHMLELHRDLDHARQEVESVSEVAKMLTNLVEGTEPGQVELDRSGLREALEQDPLQLAAALHSLARDSRSRGQSTAAELLLKAALVIYQKELPPDHPDVLAATQEYEALIEANRDY
jgi:serine/threonine protein kinase